MASASLIASLNHCLRATSISRLSGRKRRGAGKIFSGLTESDESSAGVCSGLSPLSLGPLFVVPLDDSAVFHLRTPVTQLSPLLLSPRNLGPPPTSLL